jgi:hypothetical protein
LVAQFEEEMQAEGFRVQGAEEDVWVYERCGKKGVEKNT